LEGFAKKLALDNQQSLDPSGQTWSAKEGRTLWSALLLVLCHRASRDEAATAQAEDAARIACAEEVSPILLAPVALDNGEWWRKVNQGNEHLPRLKNFMVRLLLTAITFGASGCDEAAQDQQPHRIGCSSPSRGGTGRAALGGRAETCIFAAAANPGDQHGGTVEKARQSSASCPSAGGIGLKRIHAPIPGTELLPNRARGNALNAAALAVSAFDWER
jgi:hypothetical protein